jgi:hypothetical protein
MAKRAKPGNDNCYNQTRKLSLTAPEMAAGWSLAQCISCEAGKRRVMATCQLCGGQGLIKVFDGDTEERSRRPRKGAA